MLSGSREFRCCWLLPSLSSLSCCEEGTHAWTNSANYIRHATSRSLPRKLNNHNQLHLLHTPSPHIFTQVLKYTKSNLRLTSESHRYYRYTDSKISFPPSPFHFFRPFYVKKLVNRGCSKLVQCINLAYFPLISHRVSILSVKMANMPLIIAIVGIVCFALGALGGPAAVASSPCYGLAQATHIAEATTATCTGQPRLADDPALAKGAEAILDMHDLYVIII